MIKTLRYGAGTAMMAVPMMAMAQFSITNMTTDREQEPLSIDSRAPRFAWAMQSDEKNAAQKAYRIVVSDAAGRTVWDSQWQQSALSAAIAYSGETLKPQTRYKWTLSVKDNKGRVKEKTSWFETSLMTTAPDAAAWQGAQWIGGDATAMPFSSQCTPIFRIHYKVKANGPATFYYGVNDRRLMDPNMNVIGANAKENESYVSVTTGGGQLTLTRHGYGKPLSKSFALEEAEEYDVEIASNTGTTTITVNGKQIGTAEINPVGVGGDYTAFPMVGDLGYGTADKQTSATFTNIEVKNYREPFHTLATLEDATLSGTTTFRQLKETGCVVLGKSFAAKKAVKSARLYATALGTYDLTLNGKRVTESYLNPGMTQYNRTLLYQTYDVTPLLTSGSNTLEAQLYEGWWSGASTYTAENWHYFGDRQALKAMLTICYEDGTTETIVSDPTWQWHTDGAVRYASLFMGETYDARRLKQTPQWKQAEVVKIADVMTRDSIGTRFTPWPAAVDYSRMTLIAQPDKPVTEFTRIKARSVKEVKSGVFVYDLGQNMAGTSRITFRGLKEGQRVQARFAEVLYPDLPAYEGNVGMVMMENMRLAMSQDVFISAGDAVETMQPRGTFHGFRYVELTGIDHALPLDDVEGVVISCIDKLTAEVHTSDTLLNRFVENVKWSSLANTISIPTDCPQRNERMGWSGDLSVFSPTMSYLFDAGGFMRRHLLALRDTQRPDGAYGDVAPIGGGFGGPLWQSVGIVLPWQLLQQYGDVEAVRQHYPSMKRYMHMLLTEHIDKEHGYYRGNYSWYDLGDWLGFQNEQNDNTMLFDCYLAYELQLMEAMARAIGEESDALYYNKERAKRVEFINKHYFAADGTTVGTGLGRTDKTDWTGHIGSWPKGHVVGTQTSYAVPLALGIVGEEMSPKVAGRLAETVKGTDKHGFAPYSLLTGFVGTPWIAFALSDYGNAADAYRLLSTTSYPSWLYSVTQGATSIWERMDSYTTDKGFGTNNYMNSFNHYAFGSVTNWLLQRSAGIARDEAQPGFQHFRLAPLADPTGHLTHVEAHYDSPYGRIESAWRQDARQVVYTFTVPANTIATIELPGRKAKTVGSGRYEFKVKK